MSTLEKSQQDFLAHCRYEKNLSFKTLHSYSIDLRQFKEFSSPQNHPVKITEIDKRVIRNYLQSISSAKPKTIKRKIATVKAMFNYLEYEDKILVNPFRKMRIQIKEQRNLPNVMSLREIENLISCTYQKNKEENDNRTYAYSAKIRDIAVIELLFTTGVRVSELSNLKDVNIDLHSAHIKVIGKGNKERLIQICSKETINALKIYYEQFKTKINNAGGYFFINRFCQRLSEQSIRLMVKKQAKIAGLNRRITPHAFRHSFATLLLEQDVDIKYIQHLLGHSSIVTTQIYTHVNTEKQRQILERHPRHSINIPKNL